MNKQNTDFENKMTMKIQEYYKSSKVVNKVQKPKSSHEITRSKRFH